MTGCQLIDYRFDEGGAVLYSHIDVFVTERWTGSVDGCQLIYYRFNEGGAV